MGGFAARPVEERFFALVAWGPRHAGLRCLEWQGALRKGYGRFRLAPSDGRRVVSAHRWLYERWFGPVPEGLVCDHLCRNRRCVNPAHIELVTNRENILRGEALSAQNARKTHCPEGHPLVRLGDKRGCPSCRKAERWRYRERRRGARS